jgi:hypothetical protein
MNSLILQSGAWSSGDTVLTISHNNLLTGVRYWVNFTAATDEAGNDLNPLPYSFYFDTAATAAIASGPTGGPSNDGSITINYIASGNPASVDLYYTTQLSAPYTWTAVSPDEFAPTSTDAPEASYYIYDITPPDVDSTSPVNSAIDILVDQGIVVTFDEAMGNSISYTIEPDPGGLSRAWSSGNTVLTISHDDLLGRTRYWVNITAAIDEAGNDLDTLPYSFYFDTLINPSTATATGPYGLSNAVDITILYDTTEGPASVEIYYTTNTSGPYTWILVGTDSSADGSHQFSLPAEDSYAFIAVSPDETAPTSSDAPETAYYEYDGTPPDMLSTTPANAAVGVSLRPEIAITFDEPMNESSVEDAFAFTDGITVWTMDNGSGSWSSGILIYGPNTLIFTPDFDLEHGTEYTVSVGSGAKDLAGNDMAPTSWSFTVELEPDITPPSISTVSLTGDNVEVTDSMTITFSEPMNHSSVENAISVTPGVTITDYTWSGNTLTITFSSDLDPETDYTLTVGTTATDSSGNQLDEPYTASFTTESAEEPQDGLTLMLLLLIIVIVVVLLLLILLKKKKKPESEVPEDSQPVPGMEERYHDDDIHEPSGDTEYGHEGDQDHNDSENTMDNREQENEMNSPEYEDPQDHQENPYENTGI